MRIEKVVLEPAKRWRPFYYLLEAAGLHVQLVNARDVKNAPGLRKTDKLDAVWLAKLAGGCRDPLRAAARDPPAAGLHEAAHRQPDGDPTLWLDGPPTGTS